MGEPGVLNLLMLLEKADDDFDAVTAFVDNEGSTRGNVRAIRCKRRFYLEEDSQDMHDALLLLAAQRCPNATALTLPSEILPETLSRVLPLLPRLRHITFRHWYAIDFQAR